MDLGLSISSFVTRWLGVVWNELSLHSSHAEACLRESSSCQFTSILSLTLPPVDS